MAGETFYVTKHASASNLNDGSNATTEAWETAIYGFTNMGASNTLKFGTGTYDIDRSSLQTPIPNGNNVNEPTIITDNGDGQVTFNHPGSGNVGMMYFTGRSPLPQYITIEATSANNIVFDNENTSSHGAVFVFGNNTQSNNGNLTFKNLEIKNTYHSGFLAGTTPNVTIDTCKIHHLSGVPGQNNTGHAVYASGPNLVIKDCLMYDLSYFGIHCYSTSSSNYTGRQFLRNRIFDVGNAILGSGIIVKEGDALIENNVIFNCPLYGIEVWRTTNVNILHNSVYNNGSGGSTYPGIGVGTSGSGTCTNTVVKNNIVIGNANGRITVFSPSTGATVSWNRCDGTITNFGTNTTSSNNSTDGVAATEWEDPTNTDLTLADFNLKTGAKSIWDASTNNVPSVGTSVDIEGTSRVHPDQGAYAYGTPDPPDPPVIGHTTTYPVTVWTLEDIALTLFDNDSNTKNLTLNGSTDGVSIEFGSTTNCMVT